jgi:hypothetical protein
LLVFVAQVVLVSFTTDVVVLDTVLLNVTVLDGLRVVLTVAHFVTVSAARVAIDVFLAVLVEVTLTVSAGRVLVRVL